ncbi:MAG: amino acid adenylation domain-containing protein [Lachnospiraceae bacterium]|nr:amino acid adenylation domain-containing protein [Lachnospiraceae bacterium]
MELRLEDKTLKICFDERMDYDTASAADREIDAALEEYAKEGKEILRAEIDAGQLRYISSAGIRVLIRLKKRYSDLKLINVSESVRDVISITGLEELFGISREEDDVSFEERRKTDEKSLEERKREAGDFVPVTKRFENQAAKVPDRKAVISSAGTLTYRKLNEAANRVANSLLYMEAKAEDIVCIMLDRSIDLYAATIGVLKAGCAYTIVNPKYPDERIEYIYKDSGARFIISSRTMVYDRMELFVDNLQKRPLFYEDMLSNPEKQNPDVPIRPQDLCYVIYTSGSTGKPKGVMIEHGNLANFLDDVPENHEFRGLADLSERSLAMAQMTFDFSIMEQYIPLVTGHTVVFALYDEIANPTKMIELMNRNQVDGGCFTPSYLSGLLKLPAAKEAIARIRVMDFGAEAFPGTLYERIREWNPDVHIMNGYGPTEATISCTMKVVENADDITIGIPNSGVWVKVIDEENKEVAPGETGELLIGGKGVGRGYINLPEKTAEVFIDWEGERAYKSGDLVRLNEKGEIVYLGRKDYQVKIRGLRIELGEVEAIFSKMPGIDLCVAASIEDRYLCLYYTSASGVSESQLRDFAGENLAHYMHPDLYVKMQEMPMTANLKVDRKALPKPEVKEESIREPETEVQKKLLELLMQVMDEGRYGTDTNLTEAGMSSLDVMLFISLVGDEYGTGLKVADLMDHPTILELEEYLKTAPKIRRVENLSRYHATDIQLADYLEAKAGENDLNLPMLVTFDKSVDTDRLKEAVYRTMEAHPGLTLRLEQDADGTLYQIPQTDFKDYEIRVLSVSDAEFEEVKKAPCEPIDPDAKWLFDIKIYETENAKHLLLCFNHLNSDGESINIVIEDILAAYEGKEIEAEKLTMLEYGEYLSDFFTTEAGRCCEDLYMEYFSQCGGNTEFQSDKCEETWEQKHYEADLPVDPKSLEAFCRQNRFSPATVLAGALGRVLAKREGKERSAFFYGFSGRVDSRLGETVGYIATLICAFCNPGGIANGKAYLKDIDKHMLNLMMYPVMPFAKVLTAYPSTMDLVFLYQPYEQEDYTVDDLPVKVTSLQDQANYAKLKLLVQPMQQKDGSIRWCIDYHGNLYSDECIRTLTEDLNRAVIGIMKDG